MSGHPNYKRKSKSGYRGVSFNTRLGRYISRIYVNSEPRYIGVYDCVIEAAKAYDEAAIKFLGKKAVLNFPETSNQNLDLNRP